MAGRVTPMPKPRPALPSAKTRSGPRCSGMSSISSRAIRRSIRDRRLRTQPTPSGTCATGWQCARRRPLASNGARFRGRAYDPDDNMEREYLKGMPPVGGGASPSKAIAAREFDTRHVHHSFEVPTTTQTAKDQSYANATKKVPTTRESHRPKDSRPSPPLTKSAVSDDDGRRKAWLDGWLPDSYPGRTGPGTSNISKDGAFITRRRREDPEDAEFVVIADQTMAGYMKFNGPRRTAGQNHGPVLRRFISRRQVETLPDRDQRQWEPGYNGSPRTLGNSIGSRAAEYRRHAEVAHVRHLLDPPGVAPS